MLIMMVCQVSGKSYYVSSKGNDNNSGTLPAEAWSTVHKINEQDFSPGDTVLFEGGCTFMGPLQLISEDSETEKDHIIITSYGIGWEIFFYNKYSSFRKWANTTGQEKIDGKIIGLFADPYITGCEPNESKITDPAQLSKIPAYHLKESSPCIDRGINLKILFDIDPGTQDFIGNPIPQGSIFDMGPIEYLMQ